MLENKTLRIRHAAQAQGSSDLQLGLPLSSFSSHLFLSLIYIAIKVVKNKELKKLEEFRTSFKWKFKMDSV